MYVMPAICQQGVSLLQQQDWTGAAQAFESAWIEAPDDPVLIRMAIESAVLVPGGEAHCARLVCQVARRGGLNQNLLRSVMSVLACHPEGCAMIEMIWCELLTRADAPSWVHEGWLGHLLGMGRWDDALAQCFRWAESHPDEPKAATELVNLLLARGDLQSALPRLMQLLRQSDSTERVARFGSLVRVLSAKARYIQLAGILCTWLVNEYPTDPQAWVLRGGVMLRLFESAQACADFEQALRLRPGDVTVSCLLTDAWGQMGREEEGLSCLDTLRPRTLAEQQQICDTRSYLYRRLGRVAEAEQVLRDGLAMGPNPGLTTNLAHLVLLQGRYPEGLQLMAASEYVGVLQERLLQAQAMGMRSWCGEVQHLRGRSLLLVSQNGIGDTVHFSRFVPWLLAQADKVFLQVPQRLAVLMQSLHPDLVVFEEGQALPMADWVADLYSLPKLLAVTPERLPHWGPSRYLKADPERVAALRIQLGPRRGLRVALCWRGTRSNLSQRSIPLSAWAELGLDGIEWHSLQYGALESDEIEPARQMGVRHASWSFSDAAAAMTLMDVVISIDTVHAHIAGALGLPAWVPLSAAPDWRWGLHGRATHWYDSVTLYRQTRVDHWHDVLHELSIALVALQAERPGTERVSSLAQARDWLRQCGADPKLAHALWADHALAQGDTDMGMRVCMDWMAMEEGELAGARQLVRVADQATDGDALLKALEHLLDHVRRHPSAALALIDASNQLAQRNWSVPALEAALHAVLACPEVADFHVVLAQRLLERHEWPTAQRSLCHAQSLEPEHLGASRCALQLLALQFRHDELLQQCEHGLHIDPGERALDDMILLRRLQVLALRALRRYQEAEWAARELLALRYDPRDAVALGTMLWAEGRWREGWHGFRQRDRLMEYVPHTRAAIRGGAKPWTEPGIAALVGRRLLVTSENGHGDTFQFGRYLSWLAGQGVAVTLMAHLASFDLICAAQQAVPVIHDGCKSQDLAGFDWVCDAQSLPALLDVHPGSQPGWGDPVWLRVNPGAGVDQGLIPPPGLRLRVGLAWRSQPLGLVPRSLPLEALAKLTFVGVDWFSLHHHDLDESELQAARHLGLHHARWSFAEVAAAMMSLDLVISVDTVFCHLAGALGRPCMVLLPHPADWRWGHAGDCTPWYPLARLFRQQIPGDWSAPLLDLKNHLSAWGRDRCPKSPADRDD